ncbi:hypothetical protein EV361DRAFT_955768 [Lentinula raphanica]|nr:hypothetical protein EV361DRAFT_955768 [Lentinula raphanica]
MPAHRFAVLTKFEIPNVTMRVTFPSLIDIPKSTDRNKTIDYGNPLDVDRIQLSPPGLKKERHEPTVDQTQVVQTLRQKEKLRDDTTTNYDPTFDDTQVAPPEMDIDSTYPNAVLDRTRVAPRELRQKAKQTEEGSRNDNFVADHTQAVLPEPKQEERLMDTGFMNQHESSMVIHPRQDSFTHGRRILQHHQDDSISQAIRARRYLIRDTPYPTRSKRRSRSSRTSESRSSTTPSTRRYPIRDTPYPTRSKQRSQTSHTSESRSSTTADPYESQASSLLAIDSSNKQVPSMTPLSSENQSSSSNDARSSQNSLLGPSCFGYTAFDYHQRKVISKDVHTSWYTYSTSGPIDSPPELPSNAFGLQHNIIFMHINEAQRAKYPGQLSKLLKYCVRMWIWNDGSSKWETISVGDQRIVNGYKLSLSLRYLTDIYPQWVTPKALGRVIAEGS